MSFLQPSPLQFAQRSAHSAQSRSDSEAIALLRMAADTSFALRSRSSAARSTAVAVERGEYGEGLSFQFSWFSHASGILMNLPSSSTQSWLEDHRFNPARISA